MGRVLISAAEVRAAAQSEPRELPVPSGALVTALAADLARDLGVLLRPAGPAEAPPGTAPPGTDRARPAPTAPPAADLEATVRAVVAAVLASGGGGGVPAAPPRRPVKVVRRDEVALEPFPFPGPGPDQRVTAADVVTSDDGAPMAAGYMTLTAGSFPWTLTYDEVQIVLEGELHIGTPDGTRVGRPGDLLYVPKGSAITFGTPSWAKFIYVTYPADWAAGRT